MQHTNLEELCQKYQYFILDIWGVIHDGQNTYPNVIEAMKFLKAKDKKVVFLSNAPRRKARVASGLKFFGIDNNLYKDVLSSGEVGYRHINQLSKGKYYFIGPNSDRDILDGLSHQETSKIIDADFIICTGFDTDHSTLDEKLPQINECLKHNKKLFCVNPDLEIVRQNGSRMLCAGVIANYYLEKKGNVELIGKPYNSVYEEALSVLDNPNKDQVCAIGDNLDTDIKGANDFGIASVLCIGGVLKSHILRHGLNSILEEKQIFPNYAIDEFSLI